MSNQNIKNGIETVKELIKGAITENGRYAVTGSSLNTILLSMMDVVDEFYDEFSEGGSSTGGSTGGSSTGGSSNGSTSTNPFKDVELGKGLSIIDDGDTKALTATSDAVLIGDLNSTVLVDEQIPAGTPMQMVFEKLFTEIIPFKIPSIIEGDVIVADDDGKDFYTNKIDKTDRKNYIKTGLQSGEPYVRLFIISQVEPIYINASALITDVEGKSYVGVNTNQINMTVDNTNKTISATIAEGSISPSMLTKEFNDTIEKVVTITETIGEPLPEAETEDLFDEIFA